MIRMILNFQLRKQQKNVNESDEDKDDNDDNSSKRMKKKKCQHNYHEMVQWKSLLFRPVTMSVCTWKKGDVFILMLFSLLLRLLLRWTIILVFRKLFTSLKRNKGSGSYAHSMEHEFSALFIVFTLHSLGTMTWRKPDKTKGNVTNRRVWSAVAFLWTLYILL